MTEINNNDVSLAPGVIAAVAERTRKGADRLGYLTRSPHAATTPSRLLGTLSREAWLMMTNDERAAHLYEHLLEENLSSERERKARRLARRRAAREAKAAEKPIADTAALAVETPVDTEAQASSWFVACSCGCGAWLPAAPTRPRVLFVDGHAPRPKSRKRAEEQARRVWAYA